MFYTGCLADRLYCTGCWAGGHARLGLQVYILNGTSMDFTQLADRMSSLIAVDIPAHRSRSRGALIPETTFILWAHQAAHGRALAWHLPTFAVTLAYMLICLFAYLYAFCSV